MAASESAGPPSSCDAVRGITPGGSCFVFRLSVYSCMLAPRRVPPLYEGDRIQLGLVHLVHELFMGKSTATHAYRSTKHRQCLSLHPSSTWQQASTSRIGALNLDLSTPSASAARHPQNLSTHRCAWHVPISSSSDGSILLSARFSATLRSPSLVTTRVSPQIPPLCCRG